MKIFVQDRNGLLEGAVRNLFKQRVRLGLGRFINQVSEVVLQTGVGNSPRLARKQPLLLIAVLKNQENVVVSSDLHGDIANLESATERLCRAVSLKLRN